MTVLYTILKIAVLVAIIILYSRSKSSGAIVMLVGQIGIILLTFINLILRVIYNANLNFLEPFIKITRITNVFIFLCTLVFTVGLFVLTKKKKNAKQNQNLIS